MTLIDRYELGEPLGVGGTATVFRATHRGSGREVAVKIFHAAPPVHRSEAGTLAGLDHPGLVGIDEVGVHDGSTYLIMRLVEGEALAQRIARGPLAPAGVVVIGARLADTLGHVHDRGVVHRDVKPSNVLLDVDQVPHLTDFGVSKFVDATRVTATGSVVGTPAYMAPEQVRGQEVGSAADVYALGLVLLEALTGRREFPGSVVESAVARLHRDPVVPQGVPAPLRTLLAAMTAQEPADRPSASAVASRLASPAAVAAEPARATTRPRRPARVAVAASALAAAAAVVIAVLVPATRAPVAVAVPEAVPVLAGPAPAGPTAATPVAKTSSPPEVPGVVEAVEVAPDRAAPPPRPVLDTDEPPGTDEDSRGSAEDPPGAVEEPAAAVEKPADSSAGEAATSKTKKVKKDKANNGKKK